MTRSLRQIPAVPAPPAVADACAFPLPWQGTTLSLNRRTVITWTVRPLPDIGILFGGDSTAMNCARVVLSALLLNSLASAAQDNGVVCVKQFKTTNNCYRLYKPVGPPRGLVVLLPYFGSDANGFSSAA